MLELPAGGAAMILAAAVLAAGVSLQGSHLDVARTQGELHALMDRCGCVSAARYLVAGVDTPGIHLVAIATDGRTIRPDVPPFVGTGLWPFSRTCKAFRLAFECGELVAFPDLTPKELREIRRVGGDSP